MQGLLHFDGNEAAGNSMYTVIIVGQGGTGGINQAPTAVNDTQTTTENSLVNINVIVNDTDPDGTIDPATVVVISDPTNGTAVANEDGTLDYTPFTWYTGQDTFNVYGG